MHPLGRAWHVFPRPDHQLELVTDPEALRARVAALQQRLAAELAEEVAVYGDRVAELRGLCRLLVPERVGA